MIYTAGLPLLDLDFLNDFNIIKWLYEPEHEIFVLIALTTSKDLDPQLSILVHTKCGYR